MKPKWLTMMIGAVLIAGLAVVAAPQHAAAVNCIAGASGPWTAIPWINCGGVPQSGDTVTIDSGRTVIMDTTATVAGVTLGSGAGPGGLAFNPGTQLTVNGTVMVGNGNPGSINMTSGGTLIANTLAVNVAGTWTPGIGTVQLQATNTLPGIFFTSFYNLTVSGGTTTTAVGLTINGNLSVGSGAGLTVTGITLSVTGTTSVSGALIHNNATGTKTYTGPVTVNSGGVWNNSGNSPITFRGGLTHNGTTFTAGTGIYTFDTNAQAIGGTSALSIPNMTVTTVTLTNNGTLTVGTALSGTGGLTNSATGTLNISGTSGITTLTATASGNTVNYNGGAQTVRNNNYYNLTLSGSGAKTLQSGTTAVGGNLTLSGTATATTAANITVGGNLDVGTGTTLAIGTNFTFGVTGTTSVTGTFTLAGTGTKTFTGDVTINSGGVWNETGAAAIDFAGSLTDDGTFTANTGTHTFSGTGKSFSGSKRIAIPTMTIGGSYTNYLGSNPNQLFVTTSLAGTGALTQAAGSQLQFEGAGSIGPTLTATAAGNVVTYGSSSAQTVQGTNYYYLQLYNSAKTLQTGTTHIYGDVFMGGSNCVATTVGALTIDGWLELGSSASPPPTFNAGAYDLTVNGPVDIGTGGGTVKGVFNITSSTGAKTFKDVVLESGSKWNNSGNANVSVAGNWTNNGATFTPGSGTMTFNGISQAIGGTATTAFSTLTVASGSTTTANTAPTATTFNVNNGTTYIHNVAAALAGSTRNLGATSTVEFRNNTANQCPVFANYGNLIINISSYSTAVGCASNLRSIAGNFEVKNTNSQQLRLVSTQTDTHSIGGDLIVSGGYLVLSSSTGNPAVNVAGNASISAGTLDLGNSTGAPTLTITGNFDQSGGTLQRGGSTARTINVGGNWTRSGGTFTNTGITVVMNGTAARTIGGTVTTVFNNLDISNAAGVSLGADADPDQQVDGTLTLSSGLLTLDSNTLTMGSGAAAISSPGFSGTRMIVADGAGSLCKTYSANGTYAFPIGDGSGDNATADYSPASLQYTSGTPDTACVRVTDGMFANKPSLADTWITRYWTVTRTGTSSLNCTTSFTYVDNDITYNGSGTVDESTMYYQRGDLSLPKKWQTYTPVTAGSNTFGASVSAFSPHTAFSPSPTAVTLESMEAVADPVGGQIDVTWQTAQETDNQGFNLWRGTALDDPNLIKLNADIIPSQAPGNGMGAEYAYPDSYQLVAGTTYFYWLEDVSLGGVATRHEPVTVTYTGPTAVSLAGFGATRSLPVTLPFAAAGLVLVAGAASWAVRRRRA